jgi:hypothetical protein
MKEIELGDKACIKVARIGHGLAFQGFLPLFLDSLAPSYGLKEEQYRIAAKHGIVLEAAPISNRLCHVWITTVYNNHVSSFLAFDRVASSTLNAAPHLGVIEGAQLGADHEFRR